jgi:G:T/U-mismatch repair DNA glycosylase
MRKKTKRWSSQVTRHSNALDLEKGVFTKRDPQAIARSLKASAEHSTRRKTTPFQSAMSMLNFYINRMGSSMPRSRGVVLERAKDRLRQLFRRPRSPS